jgi:hypothetical protein
MIKQIIKWITLKLNCPVCGFGKEGYNSYCDSCYREYLGTHAGGR